MSSDFTWFRLNNFMLHKHHIIPRHAGGTDDPSNLVELTPAEHAEAHRLLYEQYGRWQDYVAWQGLAKLATKEVKPVISDANTVLIALIDRIRMLDNDLIRLNQKVNTVLHLRGKTIEYERVEAEKEINDISKHKKTDDDKSAAAGES